jgi:hypothetical protein
MHSFTIVKAGVHLVSALGVTKVMGDIVKNNTTIVTGMDKLLVTAGSLVLGSMVVERASEHVQEQIDSVIMWHANRGSDTTNEQ